MEVVNNQAKEALNFQIRRNITNLFKNCLRNIEELQEDFDIPDFCYKRVRNRILDDANNSIRELEETLETLEIAFKKQKKH